MSEPLYAALVVDGSSGPYAALGSGGFEMACGRDGVIQSIIVTSNPGSEPAETILLRNPRSVRKGELFFYHWPPSMCDL